MRSVPILRNSCARLDYLLRQMKWQSKWNSNLFKRSLLIVILGVLFPGLESLPVQAKSNLIQATNLSKQLIFQESFDPPGSGQPPKTASGGSRDGRKCFPNESPIQPLMPAGNFGLTFYEHPPVFVRLPKTSAQKVILTFRDEAGKYTEHTVLPISRDNDIVSFALPNGTPLTIGKNYQWILAVVCGENGQPDDPVFTGWVQRVNQPAELRQELNRKSPLEQAQWYGAQGYWYDMLNVLVQEQRSQLQELGIPSLK